MRIEKIPKNHKKGPSEGEYYIHKYFKEQGIKSKQIRVFDLKGDLMNHRDPDFYLPSLNVFVEFFGQWNVSDKHKARYREKKRVYEANDLLFILLYPENLGLLDFLIHSRMKKILKTKSKIKFLRYKLNRFWNGRNIPNVIALYIALPIFLFYTIIDSGEEQTIATGVISLVLLGMLGHGSNKISFEFWDVVIKEH